MHKIDFYLVQTSVHYFLTSFSYFSTKNIYPCDFTKATQKIISIFFSRLNLFDTFDEINHTFYCSQITILFLSPYSVATRQNLKSLDCFKIKKMV